MLLLTANIMDVGKILEEIYLIIQSSFPVNLRDTNILKTTFKLEEDQE